MREPNEFGVIVPMFDKYQAKKDIYKEFWKKITPDDFIVNSFYDPQGTFHIILHHDETSATNINLMDGCKIQSLTRIYDGQKFNVGDFIQLTDKWFCDDVFIEQMLVKNNKLVLKLNQKNSIVPTDYVQTLSKWTIVKRKVIFTTTDDVKVFEGDKFYIVDADKNTFKFWDIKNIEFKCGDKAPNTSGNNKFFSTKEKADEYIKFNKKSLSLKDVFEVYPQFKKNNVEEETFHAK